MGILVTVALFAIAIVVAVCYGLVSFVLAITRPFQQAHPQAVLLARVLIFGGSLVALSWPFGARPWLYETECEHFAGYRTNAKIDARAEGVLESRIWGVQNREGNLHFQQDIEALAEGRIAFFEIAGFKYTAWRVPDQRYFLADEGSPACDNKFWVRSLITAHIQGKCLASENTDTLKSRYEIKTSSFDFDGRTTTEIADRKTGDVVAKFRSFKMIDIKSLFSFRGSYHTNVCPAFGELYMFSPHYTLLANSFIDRAGQTKSVEQFQAEDKAATEQRYKEPSVAELELHRVKIADGISLGNEAVRVAEVMVTTTKPIMLVLDSDKKVLWSVISAPGANVQLVVATNALAPPRVSSGTKLYCCHLKVEKPEILAKLATKPVSEQIFGKIGRVTVDGQSRNDISSPKIPP